MTYFDPYHATPEEVSTGKFVRVKAHIIEESMDSCREPNPHPGAIWTGIGIVIFCLIVYGLVEFFWLMLGPAICAQFACQ